MFDMAPLDVGARSRSTIDFVLEGLDLLLRPRPEVRPSQLDCDTDGDMAMGCPVVLRCPVVWSER